MTKLELRQIDVELSGVKEESGDLLVSGYVNQTGQWSQPLGRENRFIERIESGAFTRALERGNDVHFLAEHDNAKLLASTKMVACNCVRTIKVFTWKLVFPLHLTGKITTN